LEAESCLRPTREIESALQELQSNAADEWDEFTAMMDRSLKKYEELPLFEEREERAIQVS
jgi:hypothetical protein